MKLGGVSFYNTGFAAANMDALSNVACIKIDGLFGVNAIKNCYWKINMQDSVVEFSDRLPAIPESATVLHFAQAPGGYIYLKINTGDTAYYVEFDSGSGDPLRT